MPVNLKVQQEKGLDAVYVKGTENGELITADLTRIWTAKGYGWQAIATAAVASLIIRPSTLSIFTFYNNTARNFVIETVFAHNLVSIADGQFGIWLCVHPIGMTAPTGNNITIRNSLSGLTSGTEGVFDTAEAVTDDGWFPWGENGESVVATVPGALAQALVNGRIIIPPRAGISASSVANTAAVTVCMGLRYYSVPVTEFD